ncbi:hypothetical protein L1987_09245 [Smallanthus sonchifolius]|uniref:Uncharacterized protein n=1 Tax=Smallanthus sonchifolius TaxID=185202 RepID=A0ACB9JNG8_9ASTR|nr:hypothetical protein L1987_09245 [Smallanthus sonchifolius]
MPMALSPCLTFVAIPIHNPGLFIANRKILRTVKFNILKPKVQFSVHNAKVVVLTLKISLMDNLKPGTHVGFAEEGKKCCVETAMKPAL